MKDNNLSEGFIKEINPIFILNAAEYFDALDNKIIKNIEISQPFVSINDKIIPFLNNIKALNIIDKNTVKKNKIEEDKIYSKNTKKYLLYLYYKNISPKPDWVKSAQNGWETFLDEFTDDINKHIDEVIIPSKVSHKSQLVGQINRNEKSEQYNFPLNDEVGKDFKTVVDRVATQLIRDKGGYNRDSIAEAFEAWTVHSYAGDYNPLHAHGCQTPSGMSMILYLKVPKCIEEKPSFPQLHNATGDIDGHTGLITSTNTIHDVYRLKLDAQEYIKPKKGFMIIFPNWLQHCVMPFFGEGERRTMSANFNIKDSKETVKQFKSPTLNKEH